VEYTGKKSSLKGKNKSFEGNSSILEAFLFVVSILGKLDNLKKIVQLGTVFYIIIYIILFMPFETSRIIQEVGSNKASYNITLPKEWARFWQLKKGKKILMLYDSILVLIPPGLPETGDKKNQIRQFLIGDTSPINVKGGKKEQILDRANSSPSEITLAKQVGDGLS